MAENWEDSGRKVSFSTHSADQILSCMKRLIYDINQRKLFFQQNPKDTTKKRLDALKEPVSN